MGYFSNGTEGEIYFETYCANCIHDENEDCPIWAAHLSFAYQNCGKKNDAEAILDMLIPPSKDGLYNDQCTMFMRKAAVADLFHTEKSE